jgi:hypothetical protein
MKNRKSPSENAEKKYGGTDEIRRRLDRSPTAAAPHKFDEVHRRNSTAQVSSLTRVENSQCDKDEGSLSNMVASVEQ